MRHLASFLLLTCLSPASDEYDRFLRWRAQPTNANLAWEILIDRYAARLKAAGRSAEQVDRAIRVIAAHDEGALYDRVYSRRSTSPVYANRFLLQAVERRTPGRALDVGMGQGRNSIALAQRGWQVTGFDVSRGGMEQARLLAAQARVRIETVLASDEEFDFGTGRWDLIAILYPIEKRSVSRASSAEERRHGGG